MENIKIGIIGLGYVGLPLARLFATHYSVIGYDINKSRIEELKTGNDSTLELKKEVLETVLKSSDSDSAGLFLTYKVEDIENCNYYIVTVPTPIDKNKNPDLNPLLNASKIVGNLLRPGDVVIYESTVYPGTTEEECVPVLSKESGLIFNRDYYVGYSPERINPGDKEHTVEKIIKVTSGSTPEIASKIDKIYKSVIKAGTHLAPSIKIAEAAKIIENSQRDINIAFVNELAKIFKLLQIDTYEVLKAANTKWNFLPFQPGLVGGHCIGVDPYYLAHKAQSLGYNPDVILSGRRINDSMGSYIALDIVRALINKDLKVKKSKVLILGITFKENCPDFRNTKVIDVIEELKKLEMNITIYDPWVNAKELFQTHKLKCSNVEPNDVFDVIVLAVSHDKFKTIDINNLKHNDTVIYDIKGFFPKGIKNDGL